MAAPGSLPGDPLVRVASSTPKRLLSADFLSESRRSGWAFSRVSTAPADVNRAGVPSRVAQHVEPVTKPVEPGAGTWLVSDACPMICCIRNLLVLDSAHKTSCRPPASAV